MHMGRCDCLLGAIEIRSDVAGNRDALAAACLCCDGCTGEYWCEGAA